MVGILGTIRLSGRDDAVGAVSVQRVANTRTQTALYVRMVCLVSASLLYLNSASAQSGPREFYNRDFAAAPNVAEQPLQKDVQDSRETTTDTPSSDTAEGADLSSATDGQPAASALESSAEPRKKRSGLGATTLTLFVNSKDKSHVRGVLKKALSVAKSDAVLFTTIFHVGDYRNIPEHLAQELRSVGVAIVPTNSVPSNLEVAESPAWVFRGPQGMQIVEGTIAIEQFFDRDGNFREPESFVEHQEPTPTVPSEKVADF